MSRLTRPAAALLLLLAGLPLARLAAEEQRPAAAKRPLLLRDGDAVAILGDSITEQRFYSTFIECYLLACQPAQKLSALQFGWGGETAPGMAARVTDELSPFRPTVATILLGMNDGAYSPMSTAKRAAYADGLRSTVRQLKKMGVREILIASPPCVDTDFYRPSPAVAGLYLDALADLRDAARDVAEAEKVRFADVFTCMLDAMRKGKQRYGRGYHVAGLDGVHADRNGHLAIAYALLRGMGCDGDIGTITVDLAAEKAEATAAHRVVEYRAGVVKLESSRYPFCFSGSLKDPSGTRSMAAILPFAENLSRLTLRVRGTQAGRMRVNWGEKSQEFDAAALAKGVNLAAEWDEHPLSAPFAKLEELVSKKQTLELTLVKRWLREPLKHTQLLPDAPAEVDVLRAGFLKKRDQAVAEAAAAVVPVRHTITITPL